MEMQKSLKSQLPTGSVQQGGREEIREKQRAIVNPVIYGNQMAVCDCVCVCVAGVSIL